MAGSARPKEVDLRDPKGATLKQLRAEDRAQKGIDGNPKTNFVPKGATLKQLREEDRSQKKFSRSEQFKRAIKSKADKPVKTNIIGDLSSKSKSLQSSKTPDKKKADASVKAKGDASETEGKEEGVSLLARSILAIAPALIGGALQGTEGAAVGSAVGTKTLKDISAREREDELLKREDRQKGEERDFQREKLQTTIDANSALASDKNELTAIQQAETERHNRAAEEQQKGDLRLKREANAIAAMKNLGEKKFKSAEFEQKLRKEYSNRTITKDTDILAQSIGKLRTNAANAEKSPAAQMSMIFSYMKMLDPGSTVREGEQTSARDFTKPIPGQLVTLYNRLVGGKELILTAKQVKDFAQTGERIWEAQTGIQTGVNQEFTRIASQIGIDPQFIIRDTQPAGGDNLLIPKRDAEGNVLAPASRGVAPAAGFKTLSDEEAAIDAILNQRGGF